MLDSSSPSTRPPIPGSHMLAGGSSNQALGQSRFQNAIVPSKQVVRKVDPALSFQLNAQNAAGFEVIVATDPTMFDPANAHRRTMANFRSSRQDFGGELIDAGTGFYMLPRAFLRDSLRPSPRPDRLYYMGVISFGDGQPSLTSVEAPHWHLAPSVGLAADIAVESLSKVLGVAVEQLGLVNRNGRVQPFLSSTSLERSSVGGLPIYPPNSTGNPSSGLLVSQRRASAAPIARPTIPPTNMNNQGQPSVTPKPPAPTASTPGTALNPQPAFVEPVPLPEPATSDPTQTGFVDEDISYGSSGADGSAPVQNDIPPQTDFRDIDALVNAEDDFYDDGFGATSFDATPQPIPPLDFEEIPVDVAPAPVQEPAPSVNAAPTPIPSGNVDPSSHDALVQSLLEEGLGRRYEALNLDGAFRGRLGNDHPYYQRAHDGLSIGPHMANQDTGELGELLGLMQASDPVGFSQVFGPEADQLMAILTAAGPSSLESPEGRSPRVQPVAGKAIWEEPWVSKFRAATAHAPFQAAMRAQIIQRRLVPMLGIAESLGVSDDAVALQMLLAISLHQGVDSAQLTLQAAINPFDTPAKMATALEAIGVPDLAQFQRNKGLPVNPVPDPATHFALFGELRALGADSPVQIPDIEAMKDALVTTVPPGALGDALLKIRVGSDAGAMG